jgi:4-hydroxybenzoate polyprenyltransferase
MTTASRLRGLALACHPGPTLVVTALACALAVGVGGGVLTVLTVTAAVLTGQLSVGWSNDWIDAGRDVVVGRRDKPVVTGLVTAGALRTAALVAAGLCVPLSFAVGWRAGLVHSACVASAWAYNDRLKATPWSWLPFAVAFGLLPAFVVLALPGRPAIAWWAVVAAALLGIGAHLANVLPDLEDDEGTGVRGIGHRLGRRRASLLAQAALVAATALVALAPPGRAGPVQLVGGFVVAALGLTSGVVALTRPRSRAPFALTMAVAAVCVVLLVAAAPDVVLRPDAVLP